jgi:dipeptidyl aminopeptidase/acylaminoacyl peptidase
MHYHRFPGCTPPIVAGLVVLLMAGCAARAATPIDYTDIAEIRTIDGLSISPDGRYAAYRIVTPSVAANRITEQWYRVPVAGGEPERLGGSAEPIVMPLHDVVEDPVSQWNADGSALYVRRLEGAAIEVHRLAPGGGSQRVVADAADIERFTIEGNIIRYQVRAPRLEIDARQAEEAGRGVHFGTEVFTEGLPMTRSVPIGTRETSIRRTGAIGPIEAFAGPLHGRQVFIAERGAPREEQRAINPSLDLRGPIALRGGLKLVLETRVPTDPLWGKDFQSDRITVLRADGCRLVCGHDACTGAPRQLRFVVASQAGEAVFARADQAGRMTLYGWTPVSDRLRTIAEIGGSIDGGIRYTRPHCPLTGNSLLCVEAGPVQPPRLVRIDLASGAVAALADPNAGLRAKPHLTPTFLSWTDGKGLNAVGLLILPEGRKGPVPLVITTTACRGYLRGGAVPLAPEQILARHGIAALCVSASDEGGNARGSDGKPMPLALHENALSAYAAIIAKLAEEDVIDPARVALTGHSFGAIITTHAISHTDLFSAAVIGTGITTDPAVFTISAPHADSPRAISFHGTGLPAPEDDPTGIWKSVSPSLNAGRIRAPLLIQPPEDEWLMALPLFSAIDRSGGAVDMYVYPRSGHMLQRHPSHESWRLRRSVEWLVFWLLGREIPDAATADQYRHWRALRDKRNARGDAFNVPNSEPSSRHRQGS